MGNIKKYLKNIIFILLISLIVTIFFCIPLYNNILHLGSDTGFHLTRIWEYWKARLDGIKYPYMWWHANFNFGYPAPLYYCQLLLFPAVYLISKGISLIISYKIYLFILIALATFFIGFVQAKLSKNKKISIIISMCIYLVNPHSIISIFRRSALGELMALAFLPLALLGIYYVLYDDHNKWYYLVLGFTGLVLSHNITFILTCILFAIFILINIKNIIKNKQIISSIIKAIICTILLSLFFTLPMLEGLSNNKMQINNQNPSSYIEGMNIAGLFDFTCDWTVLACTSPGPYLIFIPLLSIFIKNKKKDNKFIFDCLIIGYILMFAMTKYFPWQLFKFMNFMQFASRLLPLIMCLEAIAGGYYFEKIIDKLKNKNLKIVPTFILILLIIIPTYSSLKDTKNGMSGYSNDMTLTEAYDALYKIYQGSTYYDAQALSSADYLPIVNAEYTTYEYYVPSISLSNSINETSAYMEIDDALIDNSEYYHYKFVINSNTNDNSWISIPRTYYYGYKVKAYIDGELVAEITPYQDERNGTLRFEPLKSDVPVTYDVYYEISNIQKYSMIISKISCILVPTYIIYDCLLKKKKRQLI